MPGVSWNERQPTDWLASNGRWYPANKYPHGWSTSALPPAPGHGGVGSILRRFADAGAELVGAGRTADLGADRPNYAPAGSSTTSSISSGGGLASTTAPTDRAVADAEVTAQRTYAPKVSAGAPPPPAIPAPRDFSTPPAPGRIREGEFEKPSPPPKVNTPYIPPPNSPAKPVEVMAGDLGKVLGTAKRRIERAINDSAQS